VPRSRTIEPEQPTFFIDRCLGRGEVPSALRAAGALVETHDDHFAIDCEDEAWLAVVGARGWLVLTKDKYIRRRPRERRALEVARVAAFVLTAGRVNGAEMAAAFVAARARMARIAATHARPLIATVTRAGAVSVVLGERRGGVKRG
jgi:hypothetical protein